MNYTIRLVVHLSLLCVSSHALCMEPDKQQQEYRDKCLQIHQKYEQYILEYQNNLKGQPSHCLEQEKNKVNERFQQCEHIIIAKTYDLVFESSFQKNSRPKYRTLENTQKEQLFIFSRCLKDDYSNISAKLKLIPDHYSGLTIQDYECICIMSACQEMLKWINVQRSYNFIISLGRLMPKLAKINGARSANSLSDNSLS